MRTGDASSSCGSRSPPSATGAGARVSRGGRARRLPAGAAGADTTPVIRGLGRAGVVQAAVLAVTVLAAATPADEVLHDLVFRHVVSHEVRLLANGFTVLGTTEAAVAGLVALGAVAYRGGDAALWRAAAGGLVGVALGGVATQGVKHVACRARPRLVEGWGTGPAVVPDAPGRRGFFHFPCVGDGRYHGFPSGHATTAFALAAALASWMPSRRGVWIAAAAGVGASRVALNAHFLGDVLGGALIGWWAGRAGVRLGRRYLARRWERRRVPSELPGTRVG